MTDYIDQQGFRANVGIVLMRDGGELFGIEVFEVERQSAPIISPAR